MSIKFMTAGLDHEDLTDIEAEAAEQGLPAEVYFVEGWRRAFKLAIAARVKYRASVSDEKRKADLEQMHRDVERHLSEFSDKQADLLKRRRAIARQKLDGYRAHLERQNNGRC